MAWTIRTAFAAVVLALAAIGAPENEKRWYKGNLHTHTVHSDGDSSPDFVARWYKEHGYQFLILSDHNYFTEPAGLNTVFGAKERFLLIGGEEVTSQFEEKPIHVNAYGIDRLVPPLFGASVVETIQRNVDAVRDAGGLPSLNHPNFRWAVTAEEMARVEGLKMFEVYNGHPTVHNLGLEEMWDVVLTAGRNVYGIAVDDAHSFKEFSPKLSNPGRGWVTVRTDGLEESAINGALEAGEFYASTGVELDDMVRRSNGIQVTIKADGDFRYTTRYTGENGQLLSESKEIESQYTLRPGERYVRATVTDSMGKKAWVQPVFSQ